MDIKRTKCWLTGGHRFAARWSRVRFFAEEDMLAVANACVKCGKIYTVKVPAEYVRNAILFGRRADDGR